VRVAGQSMWAAIQRDAGRLRGRDRCGLPLGIQRAFTEPVPDPWVDPWFWRRWGARGKGSGGAVSLAAVLEQRWLSASGRGGPGRWADKGRLEGPTGGGRVRESSSPGRRRHPSGLRKRGRCVRIAASDGALGPVTPRKHEPVCRPPCLERSSAWHGNRVRPRVTRPQDRGLGARGDYSSELGRGAPFPRRALEKLCCRGAGAGVLPALLDELTRPAEVVGRETGKTWASGGDGWLGLGDAPAESGPPPAARGQGEAVTIDRPLHRGARC